MRVDTLRPYFLLAILFGTLGLVFFIFQPFIVPLALAAIFAVVLYPTYLRLLKYLGNKPALGSIATVLFTLICILTPLVLIVMQIVAEARDVYTSISGASGLALIDVAVERVASFISELVPGVSLSPATVTADLGVYAERALEAVISNLGGLLSSATGFILNLFVFLIAFYFLLKDGPRLKRKVIELSPLYDTDDELIFTRLERAVNSVIKGSLFIALIQGGLATVGFLFFGLPNAVLWGTTTAVAALIPGVGTSLVMGPAILYLFFTGSALPAFGLLVWGIAAVGLIDNLLYPRLVGHGAQLHPLLVLLAVLGGLMLFGPAGVFLGPLSISLFLAILSIHAHTMLRE